MGGTYIWNQMDAGSWEAHWGKRQLDIKTRWAKSVVERWGVKPRHWTQMTKHAGSCGETTCHRNQMNAGSCWGAPGGSLDIETRWMQEVAERLGGSIDIETRWMSPSEALSPRLTPSWAPVQLRKVERGVKSRNWEEGRKGRRHWTTQLKCFLPCCMVAQL